MKLCFGFIVISTILLVSIPFSISSVYPITINNTHTGDYFEIQEHITEVFDLGSAVFAAFILIISLIAFRNLKTKRLLLISATFLLFFIRSILSLLDLVQPETLELLLATISFLGMVFLVLAIIQMGNLRFRKTSSNHFNR